MKSGSQQPAAARGAAPSSSAAAAAREAGWADKDATVSSAVNAARRQHVLVMLLWRALAVLAFALGIVGAFLPVMPTVPFLLLAAWAASKGWPRFERWLLAHRIFGPPIVRWRRNGAVSRKAKWLASVMLLASALLMQVFTGIHLAARVGLPLLLLAVAIWLWRRPEH